MRVSRDEKDRSHDRIVASASRLFRERGLEGAGVADVMKAAGMTHGGFYKHFPNKEALIEEALEDAFSEFVQGLSDGNAEAAFAAYRAIYLSRGHLEQPGRGCPVAALGTEVARGSNAVRAAFSAGVRRIVDAIARSRKGSAAGRRTAALREFSTLVGAMVIARAGDSDLAGEVFAACGGEVDAH